MKFLYHYYESARGPFRSLTDLPLEEAMAVQQKLKEDKAVFASQRSDDYLVIRRDLEERARSLFIDKGGKPIRTTPHYMTFGKCEWLREWYKDGRELEVPIHDFDERTISFTYGDLFPTMRFQDGKPYRGQIYTKEEIYRLIDEYGLPQEWNQYGDKGPERYIEVQIWNDAPISKYMQSDHSIF